MHLMCKNLQRLVLLCLHIQSFNSSVCEITAYLTCLKCTVVTVTELSKQLRKYTKTLLVIHRLGEMTRSPWQHIKHTQTDVNHVIPCIEHRRNPR